MEINIEQATQIINEKILEAQEKTKKILTGKVSKNFLTRVWFPLSFTFFIAGLVYAYINYPLDYSILSNSISSLGDYQTNPKGWWGFSVSVISLAILLYPLIHYLYQRLSKIGKRASIIATVILFIAMAEMIALAFIPESESPFLGKHAWDYHIPIAFNMFALFVIAAMVYLYCFVVDRYRKKQISKFVFIPYVIFFSGIMVIIVFTILDLRYMVFEWILMFLLFTLYISWAFIIPENVESEN